MSNTPKQIYVGGWARFREESAVTKKEPVEDFSWMSNPFEYEDCRDALARVPGAKEYLKNYVPVEEGEGENFNDAIGDQIRLGNHHSGASHSAILWSYQQLLNDWDGWVLAQKEYMAYREYTNIQVDSSTISGMYHGTKNIVEKQGNDYWSSDTILEWASAHGLPRSVEEIYPILTHLYTEHMARMALQAEQQKKKAHEQLIGGLVWKYKHPIRWFDTPWGSSISPPTPQYITPEAYAQMEAKYPGYTEHIRRVNIARKNYSLPAGVGGCSKEGEAYTRAFLKEYRLIA